MTNYIEFKQVDDSLVGDYPPYEISYKIPVGDLTLPQVLEGFKMFLMGCGYSEQLVDKIYYEDGKYESLDGN